MIVIGVGNAWRRDDGAGPAVARAAGGVCTDDPARLLDLWDGEPHVVVIDACSSGAPPGTIHRGDAGVLTHPASTHGFGVAEAIELARALGRAPARLDIYAIEGADFGHGEGLTPPVTEAVGELARSLRLQRAPIRRTSDIAALASHRGRGDERKRPGEEHHGAHARRE